MCIFVYMYIYISVCVCVCACVWSAAADGGFMLGLENPPTNLICVCIYLFMRVERGR